MWLYLNETYKKFNHESLQHWYLLINISCGHFQDFLLFFIPTFHCSLLNFFVVAVILAFAVTDKWIKVNEGGGCVLIYIWYCFPYGSVFVYSIIFHCVLFVYFEHFFVSCVSFWYCIWGSRVVVLFGSIANSSFRYFAVEVRFFIQNQKIGLLFTGFFNKVSLKKIFHLKLVWLIVKISPNNNNWYQEWMHSIVTQLVYWFGLS